MRHPFLTILEKDFGYLTSCLRASSLHLKLSERRAREEGQVPPVSLLVCDSCSSRFYPGLDLLVLSREWDVAVTHTLALGLLKAVAVE